MYKNSIAIAIGTLTMAVEFSMVSANANPRHRRDKIRTCRIVRWDIALAVALVGLPGGDIVTESDIQTAAIGIKCGYQRRLLVRRLPCRVLLTMVARCHH